MVTVDVVVFARVEDALQFLLIQRGREPFARSWAFPGGFIEMEERLIDSALRELKEETGIEPEWLAPACFAGDPGRDPRGRTVSAVYYTIFTDKPAAQAGDDAANFQWSDVNSPPALAFDHAEVLAKTLDQLKKDALSEPRIRGMLPDSFIPVVSR